MRAECEQEILGQIACISVDGCCDILWFLLITDFHSRVQNVDVSDSCYMICQQSV